MENTNHYSVLYVPNLALTSPSWNHVIKQSDIVSITIIHQYDVKTFPIFRLRLYSDIDVIQHLTNDPDNISLTGSLDGNVYRMSTEDDSSPVVVSGATNLQFELKIYLENKNIPTTIMDQFENGIKKESDLNVNMKVPIELYGYDANLPYLMKRVCNSVYQDMTIQSVIEDIYQRGDIKSLHIDALDQQTRFDQILIPNLSVSQAMVFFESYYGLHEKGTQVYGDFDHIMYISNTDCRKMLDNTCLPIYVEDIKNNSDMGGLKSIDDKYFMSTMATNVSVITETDIEKQLQSLHIGAINVNTDAITTATLDKLYDEEYIKSYLSSEQNYLRDLPNILHKHINPYLPSMIGARIQEKITKVDVSGVGFDIGAMKIDSRYNLLFDTPIRGMDMNAMYRATYVTHTLTPMSAEYMVAQTTMNLCTN